MKIAVIGSGAIGGLVAGYLNSKAEEVTLVGRPAAVKAIQEKGLRISGTRGNFNLRLPAATQLNFKPDLAILAVKTQDIEPALKNNLSFLTNAHILTTQNGLQAENIVAKYVSREKIVSSIVMFGATCLNDGNIVHNFEGSWLIGKAFAENDAFVLEVSELLNKIFPTIVTLEIKGMKYLKLFVNANNCIPAILGMSMQEAFTDIQISRISIAIWKEGLAVVRNAGITLSSLPDFPVERIRKLTSLPILEAAKIYSGVMQNLSREPLYGSILQSIKRKKASEVDYINGEFTRIAKDHSANAPLNQRLTEMVHQVEAGHKYFSKEELLDNTKSLIKDE